MQSGFVSGQPIVEGITPYNIRRIAFPGVRSLDWPPDLDRNRLDRYDEYQALVEARPSDAFVSRLGLRPEQTSRILIALSLPELVCNVWPDALYGENPPDLTFDDDTVRERWDAIWTHPENGGDDVLGWEAIFGCAFSGTTIEHVWRDDDAQVRIESIPPSIFFPQLKSGSSREIASVVLAWEEDRPAGSRLAGYQVRKTYEVVSDQLVVTTVDRRTGETDWSQPLELRPEGVNFLPFVDTHARRFRGRYWGISELARNMSIFAEIDATLSRIGTILDYHGDPTLQVPASILFGGILPKGSDRVIGIRNPEEAPIARYIDMPGHVAEQIAEIDKLADYVLLTSEIQKTYTGNDTGGASSGTALRLKLQGLLKKIGRWQRKDAGRLLRLTDMALRLDGVSDPAARIPKVTAGNPLPVDDEQEVRILSMMLKDGTISHRSYMIATRRFDDVDEELAEIAKEQGQASPTSGFGLPAGVPTVGAPAGLAATTVPAAAIATGVPPEVRPGG